MRELEKAIETGRNRGAQRALTATLSGLTETAARITIRDLSSGAEREVETGATARAPSGSPPTASSCSAGSEGTGTVEQIYVAQDGRAAVAVTTGEPAKVLQDVNATGTAVLFTHRAQGRRGAGAAGRPPRFGVLALPAANRDASSRDRRPPSPATAASLTYVTRSRARTRSCSSRRLTSPDRGHRRPDRRRTARCTGAVGRRPAAWSSR